MEMKRIVAHFLAAAMLLTLSACGGRADPQPSGTAVPGSSQAEAPAPGHEGAEIENKVGLALDQAAYDREARIEVTLDFGKLNKDGAVIAIVKSDMEHGTETPAHDDYEEYRYLADFSELPFYLWAPATDGLYDVRVYADSDGGEELACITIAVGGAALPAGSGNAGGADAGGKGGVPKEGGDCTQAQMEDTIVSYLSKISGVSSLTLGGGSSIHYDKAGDALNDFDLWTVYDPALDNTGMYESLNRQLLAAGFSYEKDLVGRHVWYMDVGGEHKGILFWPDDDEYPDGYYILMMTHEPDEY